MRRTDEEYAEILSGIRWFAERNQTCPAASVAAATVVEGYVTIIGVNGAPEGVQTCDSAGCEWIHAGAAGTGRDHSRHLHAEAAAICGAAYKGRSVAGADLVVTQAPCPTCALLIIAAGLLRVVFPAATLPADWSAVADALTAGGVDVVMIGG